MTVIPPATTYDRRAWMTFAAIGAAILIIVGALAPWVRGPLNDTQVVDIDGTDIPLLNNQFDQDAPFFMAFDTVKLNEGVATIMLAQAAITLCLLELFGPERFRRRFVLGAAACLALGSLIGFVDWISISGKDVQGQSLSWGVYLTAFVGLAGALVAAIAAAPETMTLSSLGLVRAPGGVSAPRRPMGSPPPRPGGAFSSAPPPPPSPQSPSPLMAPPPTVPPPPSGYDAPAALPEPATFAPPPPPTYPDAPPRPAIEIPPPPPPPPVPDLGHLTIEAGGEPGAGLYLRSGEAAIIGSDETAQVRVIDPAASPRHVEVRLEAGHWEVRDLGSVRPAQLHTRDGLVLTVGMMPTRVDEATVAIGAAQVWLHPPEVSPPAGG